MNRSELVSAVADKVELARAQASIAIEAALEVISAALRDGQEVRLVGFGTFSVKDRPASQGRNPRTGETIDIPETRTVKFRAGRALKNFANVEKDRRAA